MSDGTAGSPIDAGVLLTLKHDIKNQLSNIQLAVEGLKYELDGKEGDYVLYLDSLAQSTKRIDQLLDRIG